MTPKLYSELASWFHLLSAAEGIRRRGGVRTENISRGQCNASKNRLELGAGGGNNASHMKSAFAMTLTDLSQSMLDESRRINPECEHIAGDMRTLRIGRQFDAVFVHDALTYMTSREDLIQCMKTALVHCKPGGVALFMPDYVRETFRFRRSPWRT